MKILIVEDEASLANGLRFNLEAEGYAADIAADGETALDRLGAGEYDVVILDVMMPGISGVETARIMRERGDHTPILMLTALGRPDDVMQGFEAGADDYLPKPFDLGVLLARVNGLIRRRFWNQRAETPQVPPDVVVNGRRIDFENLELSIGDTTVRITLMEAKLLRYFIENPGRAISRKAILEEVWQLQEDTDTRAIDNFIVRLRRYFEDEPNDPKIFQTVRSIGYRFVPPS